MAQKKAGLGRGFGSLIPDTIIDETLDPTSEQDKKVSSHEQLLIQDIVADKAQPRQTFEDTALNELAESIRLHGVLQPIVVVRSGDNYQIVAGERRFRASKLVGLDTIPAIIREFDDQNRLEVALIENIQREDLSPLEMATAFAKLTDQFNISLTDIGKRVGKARSTVSNIKRLLNLPADAKKALNEMRISEPHARQILALDGNPEKQKELLDLILKNNWGVARTEQYVVALKDGITAPTEAVKRTSNTTAETENISKRLETPVKIHRLAKGGRFIIDFKDDEDYERLAKILS